MPRPSRMVSIEIATEMVESALRSFPRDSAAGPSGLRAQHMMDALAPAHRGTVLEQLAAAVQVAVRGEALEAVAPHMAGATLLGLVTDGGGVRPIAVGEVFRRLVGKVLCKAVREAAREYFEPVQVGVGMPLGDHPRCPWLHAAGRPEQRHAEAGFRQRLQQGQPRARLAGGSRALL